MIDPELFMLPVRQPSGALRGHMLVTYSQWAYIHDMRPAAWNWPEFETLAPPGGRHPAPAVHMRARILPLAVFVVQGISQIAVSTDEPDATLKQLRQYCPLP